MSLSNKTPFELRAEILEMAKDYLDRQHEINVQFAQQCFINALETRLVASADDWSKYVPAMYTIEDLTKKAQEMYSFICTK